jgi:signal transduction histidine kinase
MLSRLGIRQKLALLLAIPLVAVVLVMAAYAVEQVDDARAAQATARTALAAREIGGLIQALQQERLLAMGYLASPELDRAALVGQSETVRDTAARLAADELTAPSMAMAARQLEVLEAVRDDLITRTVRAQAAYDHYRAATTALLNALQLNRPPGADAQGLAQLGALDALMRSNEEVTSAGAILVAAAGELPVDRQLITSTLTNELQQVDRFGHLVGGEQAEFVAAVDTGQAAVRFDDLVRRTVNPAGVQPAAQVSEALTAALSYTGLRRFAQDRIAREIASEAERRANAEFTTAVGVSGGAVLVFAFVLGLGVTVSRSISRPLRRLTRGAAIVAEVARAELVRVSDSDSRDPAPPRLAAIEVNSADEIGELAAALNRVQATAALLLERQVTTRDNVSVMFANIARRTQNLVGRQLALIDDLERNERNPSLLQRLYRLDHVTTRLRRSADSLLVVSGTIDQLMSGTPTPLVDVVRSALSEIEGFRAVQLGPIADVAIVATVVGDLRLMLAELLENATNFSPPGAPVEVTATLGDECRVVIVDHGVGMSPTKLEDENRRFVDRERLDVAPTTVLGLFVVGRLARRHGMAVRLEPSVDRGVTATVRIPIRLLSILPAGAPVRSSQARLRSLPPEIEAIEAMNAGPSGPFDWFERSEQFAAITATAQDASPAQVVGRASVSRVTSPTAPPPRRKPDADEAAAPPPTASGLARRVPGAHMLDPSLFQADDAPTQRLTRDPEAERAAMNDYLSGVARGGEPTDDEQPSSSTLAERHS